MSENDAVVSEITDNRTVVMDFSKFKNHGVIVVRLPDKLDLSNDLDRISTRWLMDTNGIKKVKYRDGGTKLTLKLTRKRRERPPMFPIIYSVRHLMPYEFVTEMAIQFDRRHINHHAFEDVCGSLLALAKNEWMGLRDELPNYVIATELLGESNQRVWVISETTATT